MEADKMSKTYAQTYLFTQYSAYEKKLIEFIMTAERIDTNSKEFEDVLYDFKRRNISNTLMGQGVIMLFNLFFAPVVVAAQALANQISQAMMQFVDNVRQAVNPQVIKLYAEEKYQESKTLTLQSAEYVFDLLLLLGVPCVMIMPSFSSRFVVGIILVDF